MQLFRCGCRQLIVGLAVSQEIEKKESTLVVEKRLVMRGWLKNIFVGQAVITTILGGLMVRASGSMWALSGCGQSSRQQPRIQNSCGVALSPVASAHLVRACAASCFKLPNPS